MVRLAKYFEAFGLDEHTGRAHCSQKHSWTPVVFRHGCMLTLVLMRIALAPVCTPAPAVGRRAGSEISQKALDRAAGELDPNAPGAE